MEAPLQPQLDDPNAPSPSEPGTRALGLTLASARLVRAAHGESFFHDVARELADLFQAPHVVVSVLDRHDGQLHLAAQRPAGHPGFPSSVAVGEGLIGRVFERGRGEWVADYRTWRHRVSDVSHESLGSAMAAPLVAGDGLVHGVIGVMVTLGAPAFGEADLAALEAVATVVGAALEARAARAALAAELAERLAATAREGAARQAHTEFMTRISHELRTPLNAVSGFAQLLQLTLADTPHAGHIDHLLHATQHLRQLVEDITDMSLIEGGRLSLELRRVRLVDVLAPIVPMMRAEAERSGRRFELEVRVSADADVRTDPARVRQILLNLGSNAVKYNRSGGLVRVVVVQRDDRVVIQVHDTGVGIAESDLQRVFQLFVRLPGAVGAASGSGLGLALARSMAEAMGATLEVVSRLGIGSTFSLVLEAADATAESLGAAGHEPAGTESA